MKRIFVLLLTALLAAPLLHAQNRETRNVDSFTRISFRHPGKLYLRQGSPQKVEVQGDDEVLRELETEVSGGKLVIKREGDGDWFDWDWSDDGEVTVYITVPEIEGIAVGGSGDLVGQGVITGDDMALAVSGSGSMEVEVQISGDLEADVSGSGTMEVKGKCRNVDSDVSGSGGVRLSAAIADAADFSVSGSGRIDASGTSERVNATISGSGEVLAADLSTKDCNIRISGSGDVEINVARELEANISGSGTVSYRGNPSKVNSHASGSGKVRKM